MTVLAEMGCAGSAVISKLEYLTGASRTRKWNAWGHITEERDGSDNVI